MGQNWKRKVRESKAHVTVFTGGEKVDGLPFQGELMTCAICHKQVQSNPGIESGWTHIQLDGIGHYVCPDHLPTGEATAAAYANAYERILRALMTKKQ